MKYVTENENLRHVLSFLEEANVVHHDLGRPSIIPTDIIASIFSPGEYYFFLLNFFNFKIEYTHPTVTSIYGVAPEDFTLDLFFERMHPEDAVQMKLKESAAGEFFYQRIPTEKILRYKSSYTFRIKDLHGKYRHILHQCTPVQLSMDGKIHHSLSVHSDITYLNILPDHRISFIGLAGEQSYYSLSTDPDTILQPERQLILTSRERDIVKLLGEGLASKQIGDKLSISTHTVDTHRRNLLKKTGTHNTLELAVACVKRGLV